MKFRQSLLLAVIVGALGVSTVSSAATAGTGPNSELPRVFHDANGGLSLGIQLQPARPDTGSFDFIVEAQGDYEGVIMVTQSGPNIDHLSGTIQAQFIASTGATQRLVNLRMEGEINSQDSSADVNVWIDGTHYHLVTSNGRDEDAKRVIGQAASALATADWATLYSLFPPEVMAEYTETQFAQIMANPNLPRVKAVNLEGAGQLVTGSGTTCFRQPISVQAEKADGTSVTFASFIVLVLEKGVWYFFTTDAPPPV